MLNYYTTFYAICVKMNERSKGIEIIFTGKNNIDYASLSILLFVSILVIKGVKFQDLI